MESTKVALTQDDLIITVKLDEEEQLLSVRVHFPNNYPKTLLRSQKEFTEFGLPLASLNIEVQDAPKEIYIAGFYVRPAKGLYKDVILPWERELVRGLGRKMMCLAMSEILNRKIMPRTGLVALHAAGGVCSEAMLEEFSKRVSQASAKQILMSTFPSYTNIRDDEAQDILCAYEQNKKLVEYYRTTYGFEDYPNSPNPKRPEYHHLAATLETVLAHCSV